MRSTGIRNSRHDIGIYIIPPCKEFSAVVSHSFHIHTFIGCCRIAVVNPQKWAYLHLFFCGWHFFYFICSDKHNLRRPQFLIKAVSQIQIRVIFKCNTEGIFLMSYYKRSSSKPVSGGIYSLLCQKYHTYRTFYSVLYILKSFLEWLLWGYQCGNQLIVIDATSALLLKMYFSLGIKLIDYIVMIVHLTYSSDCIASKAWLYK